MKEIPVKPLSLKEQIAQNLAARKAEEAQKPAPDRCKTREDWPEDDDYYGKVMPWNNCCGGSY